MVEITRELPLVKMQSKYFAGKSINLPHTEQQGEHFSDYPAGAIVNFDDEGFAVVNPVQADAILVNTSYNPFVNEVDRYVEDFVLEVSDEDYEEDEDYEYDEEYEPEALGELSNDELRDIAADLDIAGRSAMNKAELVAAIKAAEADEEE